jgi:vacuolar protein sorting-associated protein VTA1
VYVLGYLHLCVLPTRSFVGAYHAAQVGISLKAVSTPNRTFLGALLTSLETLRASVGSSDAVIVESAASAYVENFALKVFASADNEDRQGIPTRKTAKKFLAASTFFDVLNVFEDRGVWEAVSSPVSFLFLMNLISLSLSLALRIRISISPACGENALC